jgi:hypothetical protein
MAYVNRLQSVRQGPTQSVSDYLAIVEDIAERLETMGRPIDDHQLVLRTVTGLSLSYSSVRENLIINAENITMAQLRSRLLGLETSKADFERAYGKASLPPHSGLAAQRFDRQQRSNPSNTSTSPANVPLEEITCNHCGNKGHKWANCHLRILGTPAQPKTYAPGYPKSGVLSPNVQKGSVVQCLTVCKSKLLF